MESPLKISFQGGDTSESLTGLINEHVEALEKVYGRMTACHVMVQVPDKLNGPFAAHIHLSMPGGMNLKDNCPNAVTCAIARLMSTPGWKKILMTAMPGKLWDSTCSMSLTIVVA